MKVEDIVNCCKSRDACNRGGKENECPCIKECDLLRDMLTDVEPCNLKDILGKEY